MRKRAAFYNSLFLASWKYAIQSSVRLETVRIITAGTIDEVNRRGEVSSIGAYFIIIGDAVEAAVAVTSDALAQMAFVRGIPFRLRGRINGAVRPRRNTAQ
jgi:hypothetical protein